MHNCKLNKVDQNCVDVFRELERSHRLTLHIPDVAEGHRRARVDRFQDKSWGSHDRFGSSCSGSWAGCDLNMLQGTKPEMNTTEILENAKLCLLFGW